ncbi:MAG TPA: 3-oxoacyl-[acyl-carrier-protein] synthase III C-terminal domain-containing protein [Terriglobales bacterium]|jgi:alkylresorcinol/alkylpyrone synthase|nr:3-oxoacyl-[acyl-carrier-protein] synthase III C-terminal domain-containing protein [Terriglobales bacterium]
MRIVSAASAFPQHYYSQEMLLAALQEFWGDRIESPNVLRRLHRHVAVDGRFLALPKEEYMQMRTWGEANRHWIRVAKQLGEKAVTDALADAGLHGRNLGAFFFASVTGISSPSMDALLINQMGLCRNIRRVPIFGLGCVAGAAAISRAADYVRAYPEQVALVLSVELCSLTLQREDLSMANLISSGLFGDGAAAVIIAGAECGLSGPRILATRSVFYPHTEEMMGWDVSEKGFRIVLSREIPDLVRKNLAHDLDDFLAERGLTRADIGNWVLHTGGPKILEATAEALGLQNGELEVSWQCLRRTGNLSSASVLVVLEEVMKNRRPPPGTLGLLAAMGPGFCAEFVLLEW